jgi:C4-dicarboxylate transporter, DctM subunit
MAVVILIISFFLFLVMGMPIALLIGVSSALTLAIEGEVPLSIISQKMVASLDLFTLLAVPFFMFSGQIMTECGISEKLVNFARCIVGKIKGGLSMVAVVAAMFFGGISGSATADTAAIGSVLIPTMKKEGYDKRFLACLFASAGSLGQVIPPSMNMVIYAVIAGASIGRLFLGGYIPGLIGGLSLMVVSYVFAVKYNYPACRKPSVKEFFLSLLDALLPLGMPVIIMGGILGGAFTATEAGVVAVFYALIIGLFIYKTLTLKVIFEKIVDSMILASLPLFVLATASTFGWILAKNDVTNAVAGFILGLSTSPLVILLLINVLIFILGCFMETAAILVVIIPVFLPIMDKLGIDLVYFGVLMAVNLAIGMITPPLGICLFVSCAISETTIAECVKTLVPMVLSLFGVLVILILFPDLVLFLPNLFLK